MAFPRVIEMATFDGKVAMITWLKHEPDPSVIDAAIVAAAMICRYTEGSGQGKSGS